MFLEGGSTLDPRLSRHVCMKHDVLRCRYFEAKTANGGFSFNLACGSTSCGFICAKFSRRDGCFVKCVMARPTPDIHEQTGHQLPYLVKFSGAKSCSTNFAQHIVLHMDRIS